MSATVASGISRTFTPKSSAWKRGTIAVGRVRQRCPCPTSSYMLCAAAPGKDRVIGAPRLEHLLRLLSMATRSIAIAWIPNHQLPLQ